MNFVGLTPNATSYDVKFKRLPSGPYDMKVYASGNTAALALDADVVLMSIPLVQDSDGSLSRAARLPHCGAVLCCSLGSIAVVRRLW